MRIRSCLITAAVLAAGLAGNGTTVGSADAATRAADQVAAPAVSPATQQDLRSLFANDRGIPIADVAAITSTAILGPQESSDRDWMMISFHPASRAGTAVKAKFQDGAGTGVFSRGAGQGWTLAGLGGEPSGCAVSIPLQVRRAWHLPGCATQAVSGRPAITGRIAADTTGDLVNVALAQVGVSANPASTNFDYDCNPYTTLVGNPDGVAGCGTTTSNGSWFSNVETVNEEWCADFTKWVWEKAGVTSDLGTLNPAAASFYTWGVDHGERISFGGTPQVGDAVLFYPPGTSAPNGSYADHVGIVTAVNSDGSVNLVDGDFLGSTNISVQYNPNVPGPSWYANGEEWAFVSPQLAGVVSALSGGPVVEDPVTGHLEVYATGSGGALEADAYNSPGWSGWESLGGSITGTPSAIYDPDTGNLEVYATGQGGAVREDAYTGSGWSGWMNLGGFLQGSPAAVYDRQTGHLEVYGIGADGVLEADAWNDPGWSGWESLGGSLNVTDGVSVINDPVSGNLEVYATGSGGTLQEDAWKGSAWSGWIGLGGSVTGTPSAIYDKQTGHLEVYATGSGGTLEADAWNDPSWSGWENLGGSITGSPAVVNDSQTGHLEVYATGTGGTLQADAYNNPSWSGWENLGGSITGSPAVVNDSQTGHLEVYATGTGGTLQADAYNNPAWSGWENLGGSITTP
jgi:hypothetical protein